MTPREKFAAWFEVEVWLSIAALTAFGLWFLLSRGAGLFAGFSRRRPVLASLGALAAWAAVAVGAVWLAGRLGDG